jgi:hypothetical protein
LTIFQRRRFLPFFPSRINQNGKNSHKATKTLRKKAIARRIEDENEYEEENDEEGIPAVFSTSFS